MNPANAFSGIPDSLRTELLNEYNQIVQNYLERRWSTSELSGGRFSEIVYTIIRGIADGAIPSTASKPRNMMAACQALENETSLPRSFRILIPRILPALYEIRNNRNVGHVGGDIDPSHMDSSVVTSVCGWIMAELVRVLHNLDTEQAQKIVENLAELNLPLIWAGDRGKKRVLDPSLSLKDQIFLLLASEPARIEIQTLMDWLDYKNRTYFLKLIRKYHSERLLEYDPSDNTVEILPPGSLYLSKIMRLPDTQT